MSISTQVVLVFLCLIVHYHNIAITSFILHHGTSSTRRMYIFRRLSSGRARFVMEPSISMEIEPYNITNVVRAALLDISQESQQRRHQSEMNLSDFAFFYLQNILKVSETALMRIVLKHSWVLYLRPSTNIIPTVEVFQSFGFQLKDIRCMVERVPSVLAINHEWTLPEKLISLQTCFHLSARQLVRVCSQLPMLLTCSIARNMEVLAFLEDSLELSDAQISQLISGRPQLLMTAPATLHSCWALLSDVYGLDEREARTLVLRNPLVLSRATLKLQDEKVDFFSAELLLPAPFEEMLSLVKRVPQLLYLDLDHFLRPNVRLLRHYLRMDTAQLSRLVMLHPRVLCHNPVTLELRLKTALHLLTGNDSYRLSLDDYSALQSSKKRTAATPAKSSAQASSSSSSTHSSDLNLDLDLDLDPDEIPDVGQLAEDAVIDTLFHSMDLSAYSLTVPDEAVPRAGNKSQEDLIFELLEDKDAAYFSEFDDGLSATSLDLIFDIVYSTKQYEAATLFSEEELAMDSLRVFQEMSAPLLLDDDRARHICRTVPWVLSYRPERNKGVLAALMISLALSRAELSKIISTYPRLLCLSVDGKVLTVLRLLAHGASEWLDVVLPSLTPEAMRGLSRRHNLDDVLGVFADMPRPLSAEEQEAILYRRSNIVRAAVRRLVVRYPLLLGTAAHRIEEAINQVILSKLPFDDVNKCLRRRQRQSASKPPHDGSAETQSCRTGGSMQALDSSVLEFLLLE